MASDGSYCHPCRAILVRETKRAVFLLVMARLVVRDSHGSSDCWKSSWLVVTMECTFIQWWFDTHYIASTIFTPSITLAWCFYKGLALRGVIAFLLMGGISFRGR